MRKFVLAFASASGFVSVALGAFAAHALKDVLEPSLLAAFKTGVHYQVTHSVVLLFLALLMSAEPNRRDLRVAGVAFILGICLFSGSLYALALTGFGALGAITPLGGLSFLFGWAALFVYALKKI